MIIQNGKFYKDGIQIPFEIGNKEQIKLLQETERNFKELRDGKELDYDCEIQVIYSARIKCLCNNRIYFESESDEEDNPECLSNLKETCSNCKRSYITYMEDDEIMVKINS